MAGGGASFVMEVGLRAGGRALRCGRGFSREAGLWGFSWIDAANQGLCCYCRVGLL